MNNYLETIIFFYVIRHYDLTVSFKSSFFNTKSIQLLFDIIKPHILEYREEPTETQVNDLIKLAGKEDELPADLVRTYWAQRDKVAQYTEDWLYENASSFAEWQNLMVALKRTLSYVKSIQTDVTFENCSEIVSKVKTMFSADTAFSINKEPGYDFFDPVNHQLKDLETQTTGYPFLDLSLNGGWSKKTLNVFVAPPKTGKTMWLCNLAANSVLNGQNTAFITCEMAYQKINHRIGANLFNIPINDYKAWTEDPSRLQSKMREFFNAHLMNKPGKLIINEYPTGTASAEQIETFLLQKEEEFSTPDKPFKFHNIFVDYVNIMRSIKNSNTENLYLKIKNICEELRAIAQRNQWCIISATQTNRTAFGSSDMELSSVSESSGLIATVDSLFGIIMTALMRVENVYYIKNLAIRDSEYMGYKKKFNMNKQYLRLSEDQDEDMIQENVELSAKWSAKTKMPAAPVQQQESGFVQPQLGLSEVQISGQSLFG